MPLSKIKQDSVDTPVAGTGPAILITTGTFSVTGTVFSLCQYSSSQIDTASRFNPTGSTVNGIPAYAFMPNVAGYYQISVSIRNQLNNATDALYLKIYKNGTGYNYYIATGVGNTANYAQASGSSLIYLNGTTDYMQIYAYSSGNTSLYEGTLSAFLARAA